VSFEIYLDRFSNGEGVPFPIDVVEHAFGRFAEHRDSKCWVLTFLDDSRCELFVDNAALVRGFMVVRPPNSPAFWRALFDVLKQTAGVLFWPGGGAVVADQSAILSLPKSMIESLGTPIVASTPQAMREYFGRGR